MRKLEAFDSEQQEFIKFCLRAGGSNIQIATDLAEMLAIPEDDKKTRQKVYRRVQKTKGRMPVDEIGSVSIEGSLSDTPQWRKMYLRFLLSRATDEKQKAKILSDMRSEDRLIAKSKGHATPDAADDVAGDKERPLPLGYREDECPSIQNLPDFNIWEWDGWGKSGLTTPNDCHKGTFLPLDAYAYFKLESAPSFLFNTYSGSVKEFLKSDDPLELDDNYENQYIQQMKHPVDVDGKLQDCYVRKSDGQKVWQDGNPLTSAEERMGKRMEKAHMGGPTGSSYPRYTIARNEYLRNYYLKRGLEPPSDDVFDADIYMRGATDYTDGWWHEQRKIETKAEELRSAEKTDGKMEPLPNCPDKC